MRLFIAVTLPEEIKQKIGILLDDLPAALRREADIRWVRPDHFHLTLKFLGECPEEKLSEIIETMDQAVEGVAPFSLTIGGLGYFPERGPLRIIWLGLLEGRDPLAGLAARMDAALEPLGFSKETRPFSAHLTLGRVKAAKHPDKIRSLVEMSKSGSIGSQTVNSAALYRSTLSPSGPTYTVLQPASF